MIFVRYTRSLSLLDWQAIANLENPNGPFPPALYAVGSDGENLVLSASFPEAADIQDSASDAHGDSFSVPLPLS